MAEAFFSESWYRVEKLRVSLRRQIQVHRHHYRGIAWYVLEDIVSGKSHRISMAAYHFVGRMDGERSVDEIWKQTAKELGDDAPSQDDVIQLLGQLHAADALRSDGSPDTLELLERYKKQAGRLYKQNFLSPMSFRIPLWDPDRFLERTVPFVRPLIGIVGFFLWIGFVLAASVEALRSWDALTENFSDRVLSFDNIAIMMLVYPVVKALHELGHGYVAKAYGADVREMGIMFLVFFPVPYVDASGANAFRSKWQRAAVASAGIIVELAIAAAAMFAWTQLEPGMARAIAFNAMVISGISTLLVNGNPLLKFDGYYALTDVIEMPNLAGRATKFWGHLMDRYVFGTHAIRDFHASLAERTTFLFYAPAAFVYRIFIVLTIALFLASKFFVLGVLLAMWSITMSLLRPIGKALRHVVMSPKLRRERRRAVGITGGAIAAVILGVGFVPVPVATTTQGVLWAPDEASLRAGSDGFVVNVPTTAGAKVEQGALVALLHEPAFDAELRVLEAAAKELRLRFSQEKVTDRVLAAVTQHELEAAEAQLSSARDKAARREIRTRSTGVFVPLMPTENLIGRYIREGDLLGYILPERADSIRAVVPQRDIELVRERLRAVHVVLPGDVWTSHETRILREVPAGGFRLPSPALGIMAGGETPTDPRDTEGVNAIARIFQFELAAPDAAKNEAFGGRVRVKFEHEPEPLAQILYRRIRQLFLSRFDA